MTALLRDADPSNQAGLCPWRMCKVGAAIMQCACAGQHGKATDKARQGEVCGGCVRRAALGCAPTLLASHTTRARAAPLMAAFANVISPPSSLTCRRAGAKTRVSSGAVWPRCPHHKLSLSAETKLSLPCTGGQPALSCMCVENKIGPRVQTGSWRSSSCKLRMATPGARSSS